MISINGEKADHREAATARPQLVMIETRSDRAEASLRPFQDERDIAARVAHRMSRSGVLYAQTVDLGPMNGTA
jgi:hypothetical protein